MSRLATVRARITALAALLVLVVLLLSGLGLVAQQRRVLTENLEEQLEARADELQALGEDVPELITGLGEDDAVAQVIDGGQVVAASATAAGLGPLVPIGDGAEDDELRTVGELPHEDGRFRVLIRRDGDRAVVVAGALDDIDESIATLAGVLVVMVPLLVVALAAVLWWLVGRTLAPVEAIRSEVAAIGGSALDRRVPVPPGDDEIARLARTMNDMLDRVDGAARRQQQFLADASHELRSPLTRVRAELEVDLAHPEGADLLATHQSVLEETVGLQRLAEDLLTLARAGAEASPPLRRQVVDLDDLVLRVARRVRAGERVAVDTTGVGAAQVQGDPDQLGRLLANLADNAVRHARTTVRFAVAADDAGATVSVSDDGPGVPSDERERIFERFARVDPARGARDGGVGLGLAIARDIAVRHGGSLVLAPPSDDGGATFVLRLPPSS